MWIQTGLILVLFLLEVTAKVEDVSKKLIGNIIHIQWKTNVDKWLAVEEDFRSDDNKYTRTQLKDAYPKSIVSKPWSRFKVIDCDGGWVCLQTLYNDKDKHKYYLKVYKKNELIARQSYNPHSASDADKFQFKFECQNGDYDDCRIYSNRKDKTFSFWAANGKHVWVANNYEDKSHFIIYIPQPYVFYKTIMDKCNKGDQPQTIEIEYTKGIVSSIDTSFEFTASLSTELTAGFEKLGGSASVTTAIGLTSKMTRNSKVETITVVKTKYIVSPGTHVKYKQQVGVLDCYEIRTDASIIECTRLKDGTDCMADAKMEPKETGRKDESTSNDIANWRDKYTVNGIDGNKNK